MSTSKAVEVLAERAAYLGACLVRFPKHDSRRFWKSERAALRMAVSMLSRSAGFDEAQVWSIAEAQHADSVIRREAKVAAGDTTRIFLDLPVADVERLHDTARARGVSIGEFAAAAVLFALGQLEAAA